MNFKSKTFNLKKILIIIFVFFLPLNLQAKKLFLKMTFGISSGGNVEDTLVTQVEGYDFISMGKEKKSEIGQDIHLEFIYQLNRYISFSIGNGYTFKKLKGEISKYTPPETTYVVGGFLGGFTLSPEFAVEVIPICFSAIFSFPTRSSIRLNFRGGVDYYFGTFESKTKWQAPNDPSYGTWESRSWNFKGKANTVGFHLGTGFDIDLSWNLFLTVDALWRVVNFKDIKSSAEMGEDTTLFYLQFYEKDKLMDFDYQVYKVSLSGISLRAGLKFEF